MKRFHAIAAIAAVIVLSLAVFHSDALAAPMVFDISGAVPALSTTMSGTMTIDTTLGQVTAIDVIFSGNQTLEAKVLRQVNDLGDQMEIIFAADPQHDPTIVLYLPVASLIDYTGGAICDGPAATGCGGHVSIFVLHRSFNVGGSLTSDAVVPAVPEPATLVLLGSGVLGMTARWRSRGRGRHQTAC